MGTVLDLLREKLKSPKPSIPVSWSWGVSKHFTEKGNWFVEGYCTTYDIDLVGDQVTPEAAQEAVKQLIGKTLLHNHDPDEEIGTVVAALVDEKGIYMKCLVSKTAPDIWTKVQEGVLNKFSVRLLEKARQVIAKDGRKVNLIKSMLITEVSLTSLPCNLAAVAGASYVGKSLQEGEKMADNDVLKGLEVLKSAAEELIADFRAGKMRELTEDPEKTKQGTQYGYGEACPFKGTAECPVKDAGDTTPAQSCPKAKIYSCPYLEGQAKPAEDTKAKGDYVCADCGTKIPGDGGPPAKCPKCGSTNVKPDTYAAPPKEAKTVTKDEIEQFEGRLKAMESAVAGITKTVQDAVTKTVQDATSGVQKSVGDFMAQFTDTLTKKMTDTILPLTTQNDEMKTTVTALGTSIDERLKAVETATGQSKQIPGEDPKTDPEKTKSFWEGATPF